MTSPQVNRLTKFAEMAEISMSEFFNPDFIVDPADKLARKIVKEMKDFIQQELLLFDGGVNPLPFPRSSANLVQSEFY